MSNIGEIKDLINAQNLKLEVGPDTYIMLQELDLHLGRPEAREPTTDGGVQYYYGKGDHYFDATLLATTAEIGSLNTLTELDSNGALKTTAFKIVATPRDSATATSTITVNAVLPEFNLIKPVEGGVLFRVRFRITDDEVKVT